MIYKLQQSSKTNGIPLTFDTKDEMLNAVSVLIGNPGLHRLTLSWAPEPQDEVNTKYPIQECAITDHPQTDHQIASIEELQLSNKGMAKPEAIKPAQKKKGMKKQASITDDDADYRKILNQDTRPGKM